MLVKTPAAPVRVPGSEFSTDSWLYLSANAGPGGSGDSPGAWVLKISGSWLRPRFWAAWMQGAEQVQPTAGLQQLEPDSAFMPWVNFLYNFYY